MSSGKSGASLLSPGDDYAVYRKQGVCHYGKPYHGTERRTEESLSFIGTSQILGTKGEILYRASPDREESMAIEINPHNARNKHHPR